jgi:ABC-type microcin C transport system permease subunit YejB
MAPLEGKPMNANKVRKQFRFRLYFWLMDICLVFAGIGLADYLRDKVFDIQIDEKNPIYLAVSVGVLVFNFIVPVFLIIAKFMRDEYSQEIWQRSIAILVYFLALTPLFIFAAGWYTILFSTADRLAGLLAFLFATVSGGELVMRMWLAFMLLWVAIFQFLRWRDAR